MLLKIRWGIHIKKDGHIFKLMLEKTFSTGENGMNLMGIPPIPQNV